MPTPLPTLRELGPCIFGKPQKPQGYATRQYKGKQIAAHRAVWMEANGPIPEGMVIDHVCHSVAAKESMCLGGGNCIHRSCYNLKHLELVTHAENMARSAKKLRNRKYCSNGHELTDEIIGIRINTSRNKPNVHEFCILCQKETNKLSAQRQKERKELARGDSNL